MTAVDILNEIEAEVSALNGEIVRRAFHGSCCQFFNNQEEFKWLLHPYMDHRLSIHYLKVQENRSWKRLAPNHYSLLAHHMKDAIELRSKLKKIWPCAACIWLYNPTHRITRFPQLI